MIKKILVLLFLFPTVIFSQDTIMLLSGKTKLVSVENIDFDYVEYRNIKKNGDLGKLRKKNNDYIFSVNKSDTLVFIYKQDSLIGNFWSPQEMGYYMEGKRQARKHFKPYKTILTGVGIGTGVAIYSLYPIRYGEKEGFTVIKDTLSGTQDTTYYSQYQTLTIPIPYWEVIPLGVYAYYAGKVKNIEKFGADDEKMFSEAMFVNGYKESVIDRKIYSSVGSSFASFVTTVLGFLVFNPSEN
jgi:hypothetical protein